MERVLIADDHPMVRDGLRTVIAVAFDQCELFEASSIDEATAIVEREGDFDLVMLDLNMPRSRRHRHSRVSRLRVAVRPLPRAHRLPHR